MKLNVFSLIRSINKIIDLDKKSATHKSVKENVVKEVRSHNFLHC